jgi:uncharacterized protein with PQ loop repeat
MCDSGAIEWVESIFGDCIVTTRDKFSFAVGLLSNVVFLISSTPQFVLNLRRKRVDGQSGFFLGLSALGSSLNLVGVIITKGLITQILTGICYVVLDLSLLIQFLVYKYVLKVVDPETTSENEGKEKEETPPEPTRGVPPFPISVSAMAAHAAAAETDFKSPYTGVSLVGTLFGWGGAVIFTASRMPQIAKNHKEGEVKNLSISFILLLFFGNMTYIASVLLRSLEGSFMWKQAPFLVGAAGPMFCDVVVLCQVYESRRKRASSVREDEELEDGQHLSEL